MPNQTTTDEPFRRGVNVTFDADFGPSPMSFSRGCTSSSIVRAIHQHIGRYVPVREFGVQMRDSGDLYLLVPGCESAHIGKAVMRPGRTRRLLSVVQ